MTTSQGQAATGSWRPDAVLPGFETRTLVLAPDDEGEVVTTLTRSRVSGEAQPAPADARGRRSLRDFFASFRLGDRLAGLFNSAKENTAGQPVVLYLHGWADYFINAEIAEAVESSGARFYALDLRKFGRSLREYQGPGRTESLNVYDEDLEAAIAAIREEHPGPEPEIHLMAHSLGGLIASLWVERHPGSVQSLILNAPWLELQGSSMVRAVASYLVEPFVRLDPDYAFHFPEMPAYWKSVSKEAYGEWDLHPLWRPRSSFPIRAVWLRAVMAGQTRVHKGLGLQLPVLCLLSSRSRISADYAAETSASDVVIDVDQTAVRALGLGRDITVRRYQGALHDVFLSAPAIRAQALEETTQWLLSQRQGQSRSG